MSMFSDREARGYIRLSVFCILFAIVYQAFGHGVTSLAMSAMFLWPLVFGALPVLLRLKSRAARSAMCVRLSRRAGIAALIAGGAISGILEIYGTTSPLTPVFWIVGGALTLLGCAGLLLK